MNATLVTDDLIWFPDLELTLDFRGAWRYEMLYPPAYPILHATCGEAPITLEVYPMDPDHFPTAEAVARDLIYSRLQRVSLEEITGDVDAVDVVAVGTEREARTQMLARIVFDNDTYYALAFSGQPDTVEQERWRIEAMLGSATFGKNKAYGRGVRGLINLVGSQLAESDVPVGQSRSQVTPWMRNNAPRRSTKGPPSIPGETRPTKRTHKEDPNQTWVEREFSRLERGAPLEEETKPPAIVIDEDEFRAFEASLEPLPEPEPEPDPWPAPWDPLPNIAPERSPDALKRTLSPRFTARTRSRREWELISFADAMPAKVAFYGEKVYGVGESVAHQSDQPFSVFGLERIPILLEASMRHLQGELAPDEVLVVGSPRRAISRLGRQIPEDHGIPVEAALRAMIRDDDFTAADLMGWRLGWRSIQQHLALFGLSRHSLISPIRAQALAFTDLDGPLQGLDLDDRLDLWRELEEEGRRQIIGQLHNANLETPLEVLTEAFMAQVADASIPWQTRSRWALALGPRGTAVEYGQLMARLARGEVLSPGHSGWVMERLKPCAGDHLTGSMAGVSMFAGKVGQTLGALNAVGMLGEVHGNEVVVCMLLKDIQTHDYTDITEQTRTLASLICQYVLEL